jgi:hypothetical protein
MKHGVRPELANGLWPTVVSTQTAAGEFRRSKSAGRDWRGGNSSGGGSVEAMVNLLAQCEGLTKVELGI